MTGRKDAAVPQADHLVADVDRGGNRDEIYDRRGLAATGEDPALAKALDEHANLLIGVGKQPDHARPVCYRNYLTNHALVGDHGRASGNLLVGALVNCHLLEPVVWIAGDDVGSYCLSLQPVLKPEQGAQLLAVLGLLS